YVEKRYFCNVVFTTVRLIPMNSGCNIDQRERKKQQGQAAAFYLRACQQQMRRAASLGQQMPARGVLG
uniref:hypothetical protein n=1 Tax=Alistipes shahii TaxID=328814 RepID=UPI003FF07552